jgi:hypothetical protein
MDEAEYVDSKADQEGVVNTSSYDWEDVSRRQDEVTRRLDAIDFEQSRVFEEFDELMREEDALLLEEERIEEVRDKLWEELDGIYALIPTDQNEDVDTSMDDREEDTRRRLDATDLELSRLDQERDDIGRRSDALFLERTRLDQEEVDLRQEEDDLRQEEDELTKKWKDLMALSPKDQHEDVDISTDEDDSTGDLDDDISLALSQMALSLCSICRNLARGRSVRRETSYHPSLSSNHPSLSSYHPSLSSLTKSVDAGCYLCADVAESLERFCNDSDPPATKKEFWSIECAVYGVGRRCFQLCLSFYLCQCEQLHPVDTFCEHGQKLKGMEFYPARKLGLGPEFLGVSNDQH